jgi:hypothetical protein
VADFCIHGNETSGTIICCEFLDLLNTCSLLKKDSAPWSYLVIAQFMSDHQGAE